MRRFMGWLVWGVVSGAAALAFGQANEKPVAADAPVAVTPAAEPPAVATPAAVPAAEAQTQK